jgi:hypothetical protein
MGERRLTGTLARYFLLSAIFTAAGSAGCAETSGHASAAANNARDAEPGADIASGLFVVAVDRSTSQTAAELNDQAAIIGILVDQLSYGDRLILQRAHATGLRDQAPSYTVQMPAALNPANPLNREEQALAATKRIEGPRLAGLLRDHTTNSTDLLATIHTAAEHLSGRRRLEAAGQQPTTLVIVSDMLQCDDALCIERLGTVPALSWITELHEKRLVPSLDGVCIKVIGADASTEHGVFVRDFWMEYFKIARARINSADYRYAPPAQGVFDC